jgi:hypothetical protein
MKRVVVGRRGMPKVVDLFRIFCGAYINVRHRKLDFCGAYATEMWPGIVRCGPPHVILWRICEHAPPNFLHTCAVLDPTSDPQSFCGAYGYMHHRKQELCGAPPFDAPQNLKNSVEHINLCAREFFLWSMHF